MLDFFTSAEFLIALGGLFLTVAGAVAGQHPAIAGVLAVIGARLRGTNSAPPKPPLSMFLLAVLVLPLLANTTLAGPILCRVQERIEQRRAERQQRWYGAPARSNCVCGDSCTCEAGNCPAKCPVQIPQVMPGPSVVYPAVYPQQVYPQSSCPGGVCPAPATRRRLFP